MIDYEDVRLVAAIAQARSIARAQFVLGGHVATLYRRLRALERRIGGPLFERIGDALMPTARAEPFLDAAADLADRLADIERRVAAQDDRLVGQLKVTTADSLLPIVAACLRAFHDDHPGIRITLEVANAFADLRRREADVAIRPTTSPPETLVGRRAATFSFGIYRATTGLPGWIGFDDGMDAVPAARWLKDHVRGEEILIRASGMWPAAEAAMAGWGQALLPDYLAAGCGLVATGAPIRELGSELWVLFHPDLRTNPRVRAFAAFAASWLGRTLGDKDGDG